MQTGTMNLYTHYGIAAPAGAEGRLSWWAYKTPEAVSTSRKRPAVLVIPGGGYCRTSPREAENIALRFVIRGYAAFVLNYSCAPLHFPVALREAAMAMRYIRENAHIFDVEPQMVAAVGFSAGGHLCGTLGTMYDAPEVSDLGTPELLRPDVLGLCYPVAVAWGRTHDLSFENISGGDPALRRRLSLETAVRPDMPPVFLWHTRDDASVPCRNSLILASALEEAGVDFALHIYRHGQHGLSTADEGVYATKNLPHFSPDIPRWPEKMMRFFEEVGFAVQDA